MKYYINDNVYMDAVEVNGTLEEAKALADERASYTEQSIYITSENGNPVAMRHWWGVSFDPDEEDEERIIDFGKLGHYGEWEDVG